MLLNNDYDLSYFESRYLRDLAICIYISVYIEMSGHGLDYIPNLRCDVDKQSVQSLSQNNLVLMAKHKVLDGCLLFGG